MALSNTILGAVAATLLLGCPDNALPPASGAVDAGRDAGEDAGAWVVDVDAGAWAVTPPVEPAVDYQSGLEVELDTGPVRGVNDGDLRVFKGIPYARPPVGELRFRAPQPAEPWTETFDAREYGAQCWQEPLPTMVAEDQMDEDCLNVNVVAHDDEQVRPVMVWIYGGGYIVGGGSWSLYDGRDLARDGDVVVVSSNYRLGALGFLATPALQADDPEGQVGNAGLLDQVELLRWVRRNIRAFGGDPDRVTVFGESAGGMTVCALLGTPRADGLFRRAIAHSGGGCNTFTYPEQHGSFGLPPAFTTGAKIVEDLGCDQAADEVACLKALSPQQLVDALPLMSLFTGPVVERLRLTPVVDGVVMPQLPIERLQAGPHPAVDQAIFGSNKDEATLFTMFDVVPVRSSLRDLIVENFGDEALADELLDLYPRSQFWLAKDAFQALLGDVVFNCGPMAAARAMGERGRVYYWTKSPWVISSLMGTMHAIDTIYTFGTFDAFAMVPTAADSEVSRWVQIAWSNYARTGVPSFPGGWPSYDPSRPTIARIDAEPETLVDIRGGRCARLRELGLVP